jgi:hypothetical protein
VHKKAVKHFADTSFEKAHFLSQPNTCFLGPGARVRDTHRLHSSAGRRLAVFQASHSAQVRLKPL